MNEQHLNETNKQNYSTTGTTITTTTTTNSQSNISIYPTTESVCYSMEDDLDTDSNYYKSYRTSRFVQAFIDLFVCICILIVFSCVYFLVEPKILHFTCDNSDIFYPYKTDTIPFWVVGIFGTAGPIVFIILVEFLNASILPCQSRKSSCRKFAVCLFHGISLFALGISLTLCLTEIGKRWVGRLRPHFISVCNPNLNVLNCSTSSVSGVYYNPIYTGGSFCQNTDLTAIREARFSFPSGHSSYSWYSMVFLIIYLEARLVLLRFRYLKTLIQMGAFIAAFVTCLSRISDYHHRGSDVIGGAVLGWLIALFIGLIVGKVLWEYERRTQYVDFDCKPKSSRNLKDSRV